MTDIFGGQHVDLGPERSRSMLEKHFDALFVPLLYSLPVHQFYSAARNKRHGPADTTSGTESKRKVLCFTASTL